MDQNQQSSNLQTLANGAKAGIAAVKAAGKAAAGDIVGAITEVFKDETLRTALLGIVLLFFFLTFGVAIMIGGAITGTIEKLTQDWQENWQEAIEEQGISSRGSVLYLYTVGQTNAGLEATFDTIRGLFPTKHKSPTGKDATNEALGGTDVTVSDYDTTLQSVTDQSALIGADGALMKRIDMIKKRVEQRGVQLITQAASQYALDAVGTSIAESVMTELRDPILYNGIDWEHSNLNIDVSAFQLTDIQALKIMAAYSVQHDCDIASADMWDLMDYCGWYEPMDTEALDVIYSDAESIYNTTSSTSMTGDIGGLTDISSYYTLAAPTVPKWQGTFAPQWYYEEKAQIKKDAEIYAHQAEPAEGADAPAPKYALDKHGNIDFSNFEKLDSFQTYGIIDKIFTASSASLEISRSEYQGADQYYQEAVAKLTGPLRQAWMDAFDGAGAGSAYAIKYSPSGAIVERLENNTHTIRYYAPAGFGVYALRLYATGEIVEVKYVEPSQNSTQLTWCGLEPDTTYEICKQTAGVYTALDAVTTFGEALGTAQSYQAYQLQLNLDVTFTPRSIDDLTLNVMGLWPGDLSATITGSDGRQYADGYADHDLLALTWEDTYTAPDGTVTTLEFERQWAYQYESYQDNVLSIADDLGFSTYGLYEPEYGYGDDIVSMARRELAYYRENGLYGGNRYWSMVQDALGWTMWDAAWCACFVNCCAYQCGYLDEDGWYAGGPWSFWCGSVFSEIVNHEKGVGYDSVCDYKPVPGDLIFFGRYAGVPDPAHIGIVEYVDEDGAVHTIEGNTNGGAGVLDTHVYSSYRIGSYAWNNAVISAYVHPFYPAPHLTEPEYLSVAGTVAADVTARTVSSGTSTIFLAGAARFRASQLREVTAYLKDNEPTLYSQALEDALAAEDLDGFAKAWNAVCLNGKQDAFRQAQLDAAAKLYLQPVAQSVTEATGFDWTKTTVREELLWAIVTTSDRQAGLVSALKAMSDGLDNKLSDRELLDHLLQDSLLRQSLCDHASQLWPLDSEQLQSAWIASVTRLLNRLDTQVERADANVTGA